MSDTPRTDREAGCDDISGCWKYHTDGPYVDADFARQLERDNAALREALQNCAISASGQNWQQIAWIVEGALHRGKEAKP